MADHPRERLGLFFHVTLTPNRYILHVILLLLYEALGLFERITETWERLQGVSENLGRVAVSKTNMADREELNFEEIHFSPIPSQTNIYGLTKIESREEGNKIFLASLSGRVVCLEYLSNSLVPTSREVPFTYIPGLF